ncbi:MAG TPA: molybdopterin-dependent oxidoreductase [Candidatus Kapabacteria bacterium]|nr:molybdopterin-dependent oxidoreductase [Candidatus Kapabacteria bacterium]
MEKLYIILCLISLGLLCSCDATPSGKTEEALHQFSLFNDNVQQSLFSKTKKAPSIADKDLTPESQFRVNSYDTDTPPSDTTENWRLFVTGLVKHPGYYSLTQIKELRKQVQNSQHVCVEGWSQKIKWGGVALWYFLDWVGADSNAKYVAVECADKYYEGYDMASARHPETLLCYEAYNKPLTLQHGAPCRIVMPTKLGYKSAKWIIKLIVTNKKPGGYWEDQGYDWNAGL